MTLGYEGRAKSEELSEQSRIIAEYKRREGLAEKYAPWQPSEAYYRACRYVAATKLLSDTGAFPSKEDPCLEIGFGTLGLLPDLLRWGVPEKNLHGIELDEKRVKVASSMLPCADLRVGNATSLPWPDEHFQLVVVSTVFTSILNEDVRVKVAREITRVVRRNGALLWYDFAYNNPSNPNVRKVTKRQLRALFPELDGPIRSISLAPPIARMVSKRSFALAVLLERIPFLRSHLIGVLLKA